MRSDAKTVEGYLDELPEDRQRFRRLDDLDLGVVGEAIARTSVDDLIAAYERSRSHVR